MTTTFALHSKLEADTFFLTDLPLCRTLLMNDALVPWVILVPRVPEITEIHQLSPPHQNMLIQEITKISLILETHFQPEKINVGALGNLVPQLHVHVIARYKNDRAWPGPIWGTGPALPYSEKGKKETEEKLR